jgi:hypothetical protein
VGRSPARWGIRLPGTGGIVARVGTCWPSTDIRQVGRHHVQRGAGLAVPAGVPQGLALDRAIQEGEFSAPVGAPRRLEAVFRQGVAFHLHDPPLSAAQVLTALDDERGRLRAPVPPVMLTPSAGPCGGPEASCPRRDGLANGRSPLLRGRLGSDECPPGQAHRRGGELVARAPHEAVLAASDDWGCAAPPRLGRGETPRGAVACLDVPHRP